VRWPAPAPQAASGPAGPPSTHGNKREQRAKRGAVGCV